MIYEAKEISFLSPFIVPEEDGFPLEAGEEAACWGSFREVGIPETSYGKEKANDVCYHYMSLMDHRKYQEQNDKTAL